MASFKITMLPWSRAAWFTAMRGGILKFDRADTKACRHFSNGEVKAPVFFSVYVCLVFNTQRLARVQQTYTTHKKRVKGSDSRRDDMLNYPGDV